MKKLLFLFCLLLMCSCHPKGPYKPQNWWDEEEDTICLSDYDRSIIERLNTATTIEEIFPSELDEDLGYYNYIE